MPRCKARASEYELMSSLRRLQIMQHVVCSLLQAPRPLRMSRGFAIHSVIFVSRKETRDAQGRRARSEACVRDNI